VCVLGDRSSWEVPATCGAWQQAGVYQAIDLKQWVFLELGT